MENACKVGEKARLAELACLLHQQPQLAFCEQIAVCQPKQIAVRKEEEAVGDQGGKFREAAGPQAFQGFGLLLRRQQARQPRSDSEEQKKITENPQNEQKLLPKIL